MSRLLAGGALALAGLLLGCTGGTETYAPEAGPQDTSADDVLPPPAFESPRRSPVRAAGGQWQTDIGPGVDIAYVASGSSDRIDVNCASGGEVRSSLDFRLEGQRPDGRVTAVFDDRSDVLLDVEQGRMEVSSGVESMRFDSFVAGLRRHETVIVRDASGREVEFTLYNARSAIPADCRG